MSTRYFSATLITTNRALLTGPEAHHLIHVMRAGTGTRVTLFDGSGCEFPAVVERVGRSEVELAVLAREEVDRELPFPLILGAALPKGERQKWLVEKAVELGVSRIVPLETARAVAQPARQALDRLRRTVVEASKQCGRNRLLEIAEAQSWSDFLAATADVPRRLLAHPSAEHSVKDRRSGVRGEERGVESGERELRDSEQGVRGTESASSASEPCPRVALAIGPEGGFTDEEVAAALAAGWQAVDLGPRILRVETAAILLAAMLVEGRR